MRIGINVTSLREGRTITGIENFVIQVLSRLLDVTEHEYYLFTNGPLSITIPQKENVKVVISGVKNIFIYSRYTIWKELKDNNIDIYWTPAGSLPILLNKRTKYVTTIYDLANYKLENIASYSNLKRKIFYHVIKRSSLKADGIITISEATKKDIMSEFHILEDKIKIVYLGGMGKTEEPEDPSIIEKNGLNQFFLYVGTLQPRKNIATIVSAFLKLRESGAEAQLVLAGKVGWGMDDVLKMIENSVYKDDISLTGFISEQEKVALYNHCTAFLFPSLYEGFGIPILEAFNYGVPVITARTSSLPEVGGDAAIYMEDVTSAEELCQLMLQVMQYNAEELDIIKEKDKEQLAHFSWDKCAEETYRYIIG